MLCKWAFECVCLSAAGLFIRDRDRCALVYQLDCPQIAHQGILGGICLNFNKFPIISLWKRRFGGFPTSAPEQQEFYTVSIGRNHCNITVMTNLIPLFSAKLTCTFHPACQSGVLTGFSFKGVTIAFAKCLYSQCHGMMGMAWCCHPSSQLVK